MARSVGIDQEGAARPPPGEPGDLQQLPGSDLLAMRQLQPAFVGGGLQPQYAECFTEAG